MNELKTLCRHSLHYLVGRAGLIVVSLVSFPLLTRVFSVAQHGTIDLIAKVVLIAAVMSKMGLQHALPRFYDIKNENVHYIQGYHSTNEIALAPASAI